MKIVYCIQSAYNSGGMERMLSIKANYMCDKLGHDVYVITTDQKGRKNFYEFSDKIKNKQKTKRKTEKERKKKQNKK